MKKRNIFFIIFLILLICFFFPKSIGSNCGGWCPPPPYIQIKKSDCFGLEYGYYPKGAMDASTKYYCFGIPSSEKKCYTYIGENIVEVPNCKNPETWKEILDICPTCYHQASEAAYKANNPTKAIEICNSTKLSNERNHCFNILFGLAIEDNNTKFAENICYNYIKITSHPNFKDECLEDLVSEFLDINLEKSSEICKKIDSSLNKRPCYLVAKKIYKINSTEAINFCNDVFPYHTYDCIKQLELNSTEIIDFCKNRFPEIPADYQTCINELEQ